MSTDVVVIENLLFVHMVDQTHRPMEYDLRTRYKLFVFLFNLLSMTTFLYGGLDSSPHGLEFSDHVKTHCVLVL